MLSSSVMSDSATSWNVACQAPPVHDILCARTLKRIVTSSSKVSLTEGSNLHLLWLLHWQKDVLPLTHLVAQTVKRLLAMQETRVRSLGWEDPLEKEMATHSNTLAWKIPRMEKPGKL